MDRDGREGTQVSVVASNSEPPQSFASVPPQDLYPTSDIRFVLVELGKISTKIDSLGEGVKTLGERLGKVETSIDRAKTAGATAIAILSVVGFVFWWALGDRITVAVRNGLLTPPPVTDPYHRTQSH